MNIGTLEILALILIALAVIKAVIFFVNANYWYSLVEKLYAKPKIISIVALLLAGIVLYFLITSGVTVTEILAVSLFIMLLIATGVAKYAGSLVAWAKQQDMVFILKELWLYVLVWLLLLAWGVGEILMG